MTSVIFKTIFITSSVLLLTISLFYSSILSAFGVATTSLSALNQSKQVISSMKQRNKAKGVRITKRFAKTVPKKIGAAALASATIGTVAVITVYAAFEVEEYCAERSDLLEEENLLFGTSEKFDMEVCIKEAKADAKQIIASVKEGVGTAVQETMEQTKEFSGDRWEDLKGFSGDAFSKTMGAKDSLKNFLYEW